MKQCQIVGKIKPILKTRIDAIQYRIDTISKRYLPDPPAHLEQEVFDLSRALRKEKMELVKEIV